jgi:hypothetical protein
MGARGEPEKHAVLRAVKDAEAQGDVADAEEMLRRFRRLPFSERSDGPGTTADDDGNSSHSLDGDGGDVDPDIVAAFEVLKNRNLP